MEASDEELDDRPLTTTKLKKRIHGDLTRYLHDYVDTTVDLSLFEGKRAFNQIDAEQVETHNLCSLIQDNDELNVDTLHVPHALTCTVRDSQWLHPQMTLDDTGRYRVKVPSTPSTIATVDKTADATEGTCKVDADTSLCCANDTHALDPDQVIFFIPHAYDVLAETWDLRPLPFCSPECALRYEQVHRTTRTPRTLMLIHEFAQQLYGFAEHEARQIGVAPPIHLLRRFGGYMTIHAYRTHYSRRCAIVATPMHLQFAPMWFKLTDALQTTVSDTVMNANASEKQTASANTNPIAQKRAHLMWKAAVPEVPALWMPTWSLHGFSKEQSDPWHLLQLQPDERAAFARSLRATHIQHARPITPTNSIERETQTGNGVAATANLPQANDDPEMGQSMPEQHTPPMRPDEALTTQPLFDQYVRLADTDALTATHGRSRTARTHSATRNSRSATRTSNRRAHALNIEELAAEQSVVNAQSPSWQVHALLPPQTALPRALPAKRSARARKIDDENKRLARNERDRQRRREKKLLRERQAAQLQQVLTAATASRSNAPSVPVPLHTTTNVDTLDSLNQPYTASAVQFTDYEGTAGTAASLPIPSEYDQIVDNALVYDSLIPTSTLESSPYHLNLNSDAITDTQQNVFGYINSVVESTAPSSALDQINQLLKADTVHARLVEPYSRSRSRARTKTNTASAIAHTSPSTDPTTVPTSVPTLDAVDTKLGELEPTNAAEHGESISSMPVKVNARPMAKQSRELRNLLASFDDTNLAPHSTMPTLATIITADRARTKRDRPASGNSAQNGAIKRANVNKK